MSSAGKASTNETFGLACDHCRQLFPLNGTVADMQAHFIAEHDTTDVRVELAVLCPRCRKPMDLAFLVGHRRYFDCAPCYRRRVVTQMPEGFR